MRLNMGNFSCRSSIAEEHYCNFLAAGGVVTSLHGCQLPEHDIARAERVRSTAEEVKGSAAEISGTGKEADE